MATKNQARTPPKPLKLQNIKPSEEKIVNYIINLEKFQECRTYREQCHLLSEMQPQFGLSNRQCARFLGVDHKSYQKQVSLPLEINECGRPTILTETERNQVYDEITRLFASQSYPTVRDIQMFIIEKISKSISLTSVRRLINQSNDFHFVQGIPMEEARCNIPDTEIDNYFSNLSNSVNNVPVSLVFNIDEAGEDDYVDTHSYQVIVPVDIQSSTIRIPVKRESKRSTLVSCICADGTRLKPLLIIPRVTLDSTSLTGLCRNNVLIKHQPKGFANTELIKYWLENIFFPEVERKLTEERENTGYEGDAVLILDGFSCHRKALEAYNLEEKHIKIVFLPPHASHLTQPLDLVIFAAQKRFSTTSKNLVNRCLGVQGNSLLRIIYGLENASTTSNIVAAFEAAGIVRICNRTLMKNFNKCMPLAKVIREKARFFKDAAFNYDIEQFRVEL